MPNRLVKRSLDIKGRLDESIAAFNAAILLKPNSAESHQNLGYALELKGKLDKAVEAFNEAVRLKPDYADAHAALGRVKRLIELNARMAKVLSGERQPANAGERVQFALQCVQPYKQLTATNARFYLEAFAAEPKLAEDQRAAHRYDAACAAAQAGCGQGADAKSLDDTERTRLRRQARDWLRADLAAWSKRLDDDGAKGGAPRSADDAALVGGHRFRRRPRRRRAGQAAGGRTTGLAEALGRGRRHADPGRGEDRAREKVRIEIDTGDFLDTFVTG
jgi:hypothetical protein